MCVCVCVCVCLCVCACACVHVYMCVCVCSRERERERVVCVNDCSHDETLCHSLAGPCMCVSGSTVLRGREFNNKKLTI